MIQGNASAFTSDRAAPPAHVPPNPRALMVHWATWGMLNREHFVYDESPHRSEMFHLKPGDLSKGAIHADCSQFYASCAEWAGIKGLSDTDYTGTLLSKGKLVPLSEAKPGDCVIFGPGTGSHAAMLTEHDGTDWWIIGFGHQGAPDRGTLSGTASWFAQHGMSGIRILSFAH